MAETEGIKQSVQAAWQLLEHTGAFNGSRFWHTEAWQHSVREAVRELREAAQSLVRSDNTAAYGELTTPTRFLLWASILLARAPATGVFIASRLGPIHADLRDDVRDAHLRISRRSRGTNGFSNSVLTAMARRIFNSVPPLDTIEARAERAGDPMPPSVSASDGQLFNRVTTWALRRATSENNRYPNRGEAVMGAFSQSMLPPASSSAFVQEYMEGAGMDLALGEASGGAGLALSVARGLSDSIELYRRLHNNEYQLNYWMHQKCLQECNDNPVAAATC